MRDSDVDTFPDKNSEEANACCMKIRLLSLELYAASSTVRDDGVALDVVDADADCLFALTFVVTGGLMTEDVASVKLECELTQDSII
jgi:hypothetical protein